MSDPLVISALENGEPKLMAGQAEALLDKLDRLLRRCVACRRRTSTWR